VRARCWSSDEGVGDEYDGCSGAGRIVVQQVRSTSQQEYALRAAPAHPQAQARASRFSSEILYHSGSMEQHIALYVWLISQAARTSPGRVSQGRKDERRVSERGGAVSSVPEEYPMMPVQLRSIRHHDGVTHRERGLRAMCGHVKGS